MRVSTRRFHSALYRISLTSVLLPDPEAPVTRRACPAGSSTSMFLRLFSRAPRTVSVLPLPGRRRFGRGDRPLAREELAGQRRLAREQVGERPLHDHAAAVHARARAHLDDVIRRADRVLVVLDDDHGVADVAQALERGDHLDVVLGVQPDARLVEHVQHAHQPRADLRGQPDPLRLAARERGRPAVQVQIVQPDADEQLEAAADLLEDLLAGRVRRRGLPV